MSDLKSFVLLQARLYEFLAQQDETTLHAIVSGAAHLAVLRADDAQAVSPVLREEARTPSGATSTGLTMVPAQEPLQVAHDLSELASEQARRIYLNAAGLQAIGLKRVAKAVGLTGYSRLSKAKLVDLLVGHDLGQSGGLTGEPKTPWVTSSRGPVGESDVDQPATIQQRRRSTVPSSTESAEPNAEAAAIASRLRETETEEEGAVYLRAQNLDREALLAVAAELQLTRVDRLSQTELTRRVLKQAIGARRKFAGLRSW